MAARCYKLREIAALVGGTLDGDENTEIRGVAGIREAVSGDITFVANPKYEAFVETTAASAVIARSEVRCAKPLIRIDDPYYAYMLVLRLFAEEVAVPYSREVHITACVDSTARLGENVSVGALTAIAAMARVGDNTTIVGSAFIGYGVEIGCDCLIYPGVVVREGSVIGNRVILQPGVVIGSDGFGFARANGRNNKVPQIGRVVIEDDVEIGANSCVDRATTGETRICRGVKIDNLVQIAHNVIVGENTVIAAQAGISGSTQVGRDVVIAGQAGIAGHVAVGDGAVLAGRAGVTKDVPGGMTVSGYPAREHAAARRIQACTSALPELFQRVRELERKAGDER